MSMTDVSSNRLPLLMLPGLLCDEAFWSNQIHGLGDICRPRVAKFGLADSFGEMAQRVLADAPERFAVVGHSMGGRVAQEIYRRAPERVLALGLFATDYRAPANDAAAETERKGREENVQKARLGGMRAYGQAWVERVVAPDRRADRSLVDAIVAMVERQSPEILAAQSHAGVTRPDYSDVLPSIRCPTLVCAGDLDHVRNVEVHRAMKALIPGAELVVIEHSGHMIAMERPDAVTAAMRDWITTATRKAHD